MADPLDKKSTQFQSGGTPSGANSGTQNNPPTPQNAYEESVSFINGEVLDPPTQGKISFVGPYAEQTLVMALEDARSFLQGAEQIVLIALAKALAKAVGTPEAQPAPHSSVHHADVAGGEDTKASPDAGLYDGAAPVKRQQKSAPGQEARGHIPPAPAAPVADGGLKAIESVMASLTLFHASLADTTHRYRHPPAVDSTRNFRMER
jgi:hypothetical protein